MNEKNLPDFSCALLKPMKIGMKNGCFWAYMGFAHKRFAQMFDICRKRTHRSNPVLLLGIIYAQKCQNIGS